MEDAIEPLVPTGYFFGKVADGVISDKTYDKCIAWVEKNKDNPERLSVADNIFDSKYEDIIIPDTVQCFQDVIVHIDDIILEFTKGQLELEGVWGNIWKQVLQLLYTLTCHRLTVRTNTICPLYFIYRQTNLTVRLSFR